MWAPYHPILLAIAGINLPTYTAVAADTAGFATGDILFTISAVVVLDLRVSSGKLPTEIWSGCEQCFEAWMKLQPGFVALRDDDRPLT
jgi:hypothetical protein